MTKEKLDCGCALYDEIQRRKSDIAKIEGRPIVSAHGCTQKLTESESALDLKLREMVCNKIKKVLKKLELEFSKL